LKAHLKSGFVNIKNLDPLFDEAEKIISRVFVDWLEPFYTMTITSGNDSSHSQHSLHYKNEAIDIRIRDFIFDGIPTLYPFSNSWWDLTEAMCKHLALKLSPVFVMVLEKNHIHLQIGGDNIKNFYEDQNLYISKRK